MGYCLAYFKKFIIVIFYNKKSTRDFICLKSYQLISLLNIVEKIIKAVIVVRISYMATTNKFLSKIHFENRYRSYAKTAIYYLLKIYAS